MEVRALLEGIDVKEIRGAEGRVLGISSDSRRIKRGWMFVCVRGMHHDGHDYIGEALRNGAVFLVGEDRERLAAAGVGFAVCENTRLAEAMIWNNRYGDPARDMKTVAVTGSMGKTSTVMILREILRSAGVKTGVITSCAILSPCSII